jgi:hypothetical protein
VGGCAEARKYAGAYQQDERWRPSLIMYPHAEVDFSGAIDGVIGRKGDLPDSAP